MKNFKYKTIATFFDADNVPCVFVAELIKQYKGINTFDLFYKKTWEIDGVLVMALLDATIYINEIQKVEKYLFINYAKGKIMNNINGCIYDVDSGKCIGVE